MEIIKWLNANFYFPHCKSAKNISHLKNGIAIAQVLTDLLPEHYHHFFLPQIQIHNLTVDNCINNLKIILNTISTCTQNQQVKQFTPQSLYYRDTDMVRFMKEVLMKLQLKNEPENYSEMVAAHVCENRRIPVSNIEELSEIANISSLVIKQPQKNLDALEVVQSFPQRKDQQEQEEESFILDRDQFLRLQKWISEIGLDTSQVEENPQYLFGSIVNYVFSEGRMNQPVIKQAHFSLGPNSIYRKALNFLLKNQKAEKMQKNNALEMLKQIEENSIIKEGTFWATLNDIYKFAFKRFKAPKQTNSGKSKEKPQQKQNAILNRKPTSKATIKTVKQTNNYSMQILRQTEKWIGDELGYEHSLKKSKVINNLLQNPLFNGNLFGSIVMRLKIGRPNIIKEPRQKKHLIKNFQQIKKVCLHRNYKCMRKISLVQPSYEEYLGILSEVRSEHKVQNPQITQQKETQKQKCNQCELKRSCIRISPESKTQIINFVRDKFNITIEKLTVSKLTQVCSELLNINLYRQTTLRIQETNIDKILAELRRVGFSSYYLTDREQVQKKEEIRWSILTNMVGLVEGNVSYC